MFKKFLLPLFFIAFFILSFSLYYLNIYSNIDSIWIYIVYLFSTFFSVIGGLYCIKIYGLKNFNGRSMLFITLGLLFWFVGETFWFIYRYFLDIFPFPSIPDFFYLAAYPIIAIGIYIQIKNSKINLDKTQKMFFSMFGIVVFGLVTFLMFNLSYASGLGFFEILFNILYNMADATLFFLAFLVVFIVLQYKQGRISKPWFIFSLAILIMFFGDFLFGFYGDEYEAADNIFFLINDMLYITSYLLFSYSLFNIGLTTKRVRDKFFEI